MYSSLNRAGIVPTAIAIVAIIVAANGAGFAQSSNDIEVLLKELEAIKQAQAAIQKELAELKALVQKQGTAPAAQAARPTPVGRTVNLAGAPFKGRADAPLTLVEYSDFQCPFCARHVTQSLPRILAEYVDTGKLKYVFRHFPLENIHPLALKAAEAAECANDQKKFWPMHDRLFANQTLLAQQHMPAHAAAVGLDVAPFEQCLSTGKYTAKVRKDFSEGTSVGVTGTPAFVLGRTIPATQTLKVETFISGAKAYASFKEEFDRLLSAAP